MKRNHVNGFSVRQTIATAILAGTIGLFGFAAPAAAQTTQPSGPAYITDGIGNDGRIHLVVNRSQVLTTKTPYKRVNVAQPEIADVNPIAPSSVLVTAKKPGSTQLILWDDNDKAQLVEVVVDFDLVSLNELFKTQFPNSKIEATAVNGSIMLKGRAPNLEAADQAGALAAPYGTQGAKVLNFLEVAGGQQVMLQVRFAEVSRTASSSLGFNMFGTDGKFRLGVGTGAAGSPLGGLAAGTPDTAVPSSATVFGATTLGSTQFEMFISALRTNNLLRVLAEPNLTAISGQEASFLAGGEFPVPVPQASSTGGTTITIEYKQFGVGLKFVPIVLGDGRIRLKCAPEVSDLDFSNAVTLNGFKIPALTKRNLNTTVELKEGQTLALAGLLNNTISTSADVTPLLGDIPVLGALFRSTSYQRKETELVVLVTPKLVGGMNPDQVPALPGEKWRIPTEADLFWLRDLGGEVPADKKPVKTGQPARFQGSYGFTPATPIAGPVESPKTTVVTPATPAAKPAPAPVRPTTKATGK